MRLQTFMAVALVSVVALFGLWSTADADLTAVGPVDPVTGFPSSFTDINQLTIGPCGVITAPAGGVNGPPCGALALFNFANGFVLDNIEEVTFYRAESVAGANSRLRIEVQGGCNNVPPAFPPCGGEAVINGALLRLQPADMTIAGDYTVTTPIGEFIIPVADPLAVVNVPLGPTGTGVDPDFVTALPGAVQFFVPNGTAFTNAQGSFLGDSLTPSPLTPGFGWPTLVLGADGPGELVFRVVTPDAFTTIDATGFTVEGQVLTFPLTVSKAGNGTGTVTSTSDPVQAAQINCDPACTTQTVQFLASAVVTLTFTPSATSVLTGEPTGCDAASFIAGPPATCLVTMNASKTVVATFNEQVNITVAPPSLAAGAINVGSTALRTITVQNTGVTTGLTVGQITMAPALADITIRSDNCSNTTIAPLGSCTVQLNVAPVTVGQKSTTLSIPSNDPQTAVMNVPLSVVGSVVPVFADVPEGGFAENFINSIFYSGITGGCGGGNFCPNSPITRAQMAVFLETSLGVAAAPPCLGNIFLDVNAAVMSPAFCGFIEKLAADGITGGCGGSNFCPNDPVTRGQMAVFIEAALGNPPNACTDQFADSTAALVGPAFCGFIERLAADGITAGCAPGLFCPNDPVTRAQMAVFLVAAPPPLMP